MRFVLALLGLLLGGCTWSNSLYHARRLSNSALKAEREDRSFDATSFWGQVAVKADSAYARDPDGGAGAEALWLRGRALARLGDCGVAQPLLERAMVSAGGVDWRDDLALELARCRVVSSDPASTLAVLAPLLAGPDDRVAAAARPIAASALGQLGRWAEALDMMDGDPTTAASWQRAVALAHLGRLDAALDEVQPQIDANDSTADWDALVRATASRPDGRTAELLARLGAMPFARDTVEARWLGVAVLATIPHDPAAADRMLETLAAMPASSSGRLLLAERRMMRVTDSTSLATTVAALADLGRGDALVMVSAYRLGRWGRTMLADLDSLAPGAADGDLAMYYHATIARDTLHAPRLATWFLAKLERDWPTSPLVGKALLARMILQPDSVDALRPRLLALVDSPYLAYVQDRADPRFAEIEEHLAFYFLERLAETTGGQDDP